ncbi:MAG: fumarylacetoacetate hydrolase family protein [Burkholderiaceae bacterium]|nr:fumarylacetoacetate hydrolase family protein [Burkholderiaceae bacterium]
MSVSFDAAAIAAELLQAHRDGKNFEPLRPGSAPLSIEQGYEVQRCLVDRMCKEQATDVAGYKIGLTSRVMQEMCRISHPVYGCILRSRVAGSGFSAPLAAYGRLGIESEIAVRMGQDLPIGKQPPTLQQVAASIADVAVALELVDDRHASYDPLDAAWLVADNAWNGGIVLGPWRPAPPDLGGRAGRLTVDGVVVDQGHVGTDGAHPFASVAWLAAALAVRGQQLRRGDIVMTGSILGTRFPARTEHWRFEVDGLGEVEAKTLR